MNRRHRKIWSGTLLLVLLFPGWAVIGPVNNLHAQELNAEQVGRAITGGVRFLKGEQDANTGRWNSIREHKGGVEALVTLALLLSGVDARDATIQRSIRYLNSLDLRDDRLSVYTASLMTLVYCELDADLYRSRIRSCVEFLGEAQIAQGPLAGGWSYYLGGGRPDGSNSQFAILALSEASKYDIDVAQDVWQRAQWYWEAMYKGNGRFIYRDDQYHRDVATGSMVCAAISSLIIIDEHLAKRVPLENGRVRCCGTEDRLEMVEAANQWMERHFTTRENPADSRSIFSVNRFYFLYSMERAARLSGQRFFGQHDWYREGAQTLIALQRNNGRWQTSAGHGETNVHVASSLALLFPSKGRRPIVIGKYQHSSDNDWDRHRKGVHYLTRQLESDWKVKLNWQTIEGRFASADDLLEAPVLFISGRDALRLSNQQKEALRKYIEYGGFVFAEACQGDGCGDDVGFDRDFQALMLELFPDSRFQLLDDQHPVFQAQYNLPANPEWPLYGLQSSCRTSVIYCPRNMAGFWRLNRPSFLNQLPDVPRRQVDYATQLGANVVAYATGRDVKDKLDRPQVMETVGEGLGQRVVLIPKLTHSGGADDAPNAWQNIMRRASFDLKTRFKIVREMISPSPEELANFPMVFMHGRAPFRWSEEQREALRNYFANGGFLFADSICSSDGFSKAFRDEMKQLFPEQELMRIPATDRIWADDAGGYQLDSVGMHEPANVPGGVREFRTPPLMEGIQVDGRWIVVFSPQDLSCAMENASATQCAGYNRDDAARLGVNVILYALRPWNQP
ncbi:MAG: DUF4159 domain-containing protein [Pirellulaceae bacterium]